MQILSCKKNSHMMASKRDLGMSWTRLGRELGQSGASFGHFWPVFGRFFALLNWAFFAHGAKMGSRRPFGVNFGWIFEGSGRVLGRFWGGFGWFLEWFWVDFGKDLIYEEDLILNLNSSLHAEVWLTLCVFSREKPYFCWTHFALQRQFVYVRTPALPRFAPRSVPIFVIEFDILRLWKRR